jgi:hypothetical protein
MNRSIRKAMPFRRLFLFLFIPLLAGTASAASANNHAAWAVGVGLIFIGLVCVIYPLPTITAFAKGHRNRWVILVINIAFGATVIGWLVALVWALNKVDDPIKGGVKYDLQPNDPLL